MRSWLQVLMILPLAPSLVGATPATQASNTLEGRWDGVILVQPAEVEVDFYVVLQRDQQGSLTGRVSFPTQGPTEYPLTSLRIEGDQIEFSNKDQSGIAASYTAVLSPDRKTMAGDVTEQGVTKPFTLHKLSQASAGGQQAAVLQTLSKDGRELKERFNQDTGSVRLLMILSPSCGMCRMGARVVQRHVLEKINDARVRVYVVWEPTNSLDDEQAARQATSFISGERVTHFWSADRFTGKSFQSVAAPQDAPIWDVFLVFASTKQWGADGPPAPDSLMHNLREREDLPKDRYLNGAKLATEIQNLLH